jgi:hypothetical protein
MAEQAKHEGQALVRKLLKAVDKKPMGVCVGATLRTLGILIDTHVHSGGTISIEAVHAELDELLATFSLFRAGAEGARGLN